MDEIKSAGGAILAALVAAALALPKLLNMAKSDRLDGKLLERLDGMDEKIHGQAVRITRLTVLVIRLEALLIANNINIPKDVQEELNSLRDDSEAAL